MTCKNCGQEVPENVSFCANCGVRLEVPEAPPAAPVQNAAPSVPHENKPLSPWAYFGYQILFSIPLVGFIMLIILSTKAAHNVNLRNFARSYWCAVLIGAIVGILIVILALILSAVFGLSLSALFAEFSPNYYY